MKKAIHSNLTQFQTYKASRQNKEERTLNNYNADRLEQEGVPVTTVFFWVSLEELYSGTLKHLAIKVKRRNQVTDDYDIHAKLITININRRWREGERVIRENAGDELENDRYHTLVFVMKEKPHHLFTREGDNLRMKVCISSKEAVFGFIRHYTLLDGRILKIKRTNSLISSNEENRLHGEGMANPATGRRGDLIINFEVMFAAHYTAEQRQQSTVILDQQ
ncbi:unnamed protein product [Rhizopus stolonifer]